MMNEAIMRRITLENDASSAQVMQAPMTFFPRDKLFWLVNVLAWLFVLDNLAGALFGQQNETGSTLPWPLLAAMWLVYLAAGILAVLVFRHFFYRKQWGERRLIASLPLALAIALVTGALLSFVVQLPFDAMTGRPAGIFAEGEALFLFVSGTVSQAVWRGAALALLYFLWLLGYWGISASLNARNLALRSLALENHLRGARLDALSGQINPHFLFNALNNIRFMIGRDAARAEDSLVALSEILRHSLSTSRQQKVPLSEELTIAGKYLSLMKDQMQNRLDYTVQFDPVIGNCLVPPMIIQMAAENAIKHGVEQIREGGRIDIQCSAVADTMHLEVRNTWAPPPAGAAHPVQGPGELQVTSESGLGLANIRKRLALLYGDKAQLSMTRQAGDFVVTLAMPIERFA